MPTFDLVLSSLLTFVGFYHWGKYKFRSLLLVSLAGCVSVSIGVLASIYKGVLLDISSVATSLLIIVFGWCFWKVFRDKFFFWVSLFGTISVVTKIFDYYIARDILNLSDKGMMISSIIILVIRAIAYYAIFRILFSDLKPKSY